jgi:hypothetical protein
MRCEKCKHPEGYTAMGTTTGRMYCAYCRKPKPDNEEKNAYLRGFKDGRAYEKGK